MPSTNIIRTKSATTQTTQPCPAGAVGMFSWDDNNIVEKQRCRLQFLNSFYTEQLLRSVLLPVLLKTHRVSLRALDWLVTNYSKKNPVVYQTLPDNPFCPQPTLVNIYKDYKVWLRTHKRRNFDMFRRHGKVKFQLDDTTYYSTVAQLNFFAWAVQFEVLQYAEKNIQIIEQDHTRALAHAKLVKKQQSLSLPAGSQVYQKAHYHKRRQPLTPVTPGNCFVYDVHLQMKSTWGRVVEILKFISIAN